MTAEGGGCVSPLRPRYIVLGAGPAGCVVASELVKRQQGLVVLLDMGPAQADGRSTSDPRKWFSAAMYSAHAHNYLTLPHTRMHNRVLLWPRGKGPGGCGLVNAMQYSRGYREDYKEWPQGSWSMAQIDRAYERLEASLTVSQADDGRNLLSEAFRSAAAHLGVSPASPSAYMSPNTYSAMRYTAAKDQQGKWRRRTPYQELVEPLLHSKNFVTVFNARACRVLFEAKTAVGVLYHEKGAHGAETTLLLETHEEQNGHSATHTCASARPCVIVSAGALETPKLLMLSGIGQPEHLAQHNIQVVHPLGCVGKGLKDHMLVPVMRLNRRYVSPSLRSPNAMHGWLNVKVPHQPHTTDKELRLQIITCDFSVAPDLAPEVFLPRYPGTIWCVVRWFLSLLVRILMLFPPIRWLGQQAVGCLVCIMNTQSEGSVRLSGLEPEDPPLIDARCFTDPCDVTAFAHGVSLAQELLSSPQLTQTYASPIELLPGPFFSKKDTHRFVSLFGGSYFHPTSTCRMGKVVDERLRVHGVEGLRIADASVLPDVISAGPMAATMMVGMRCADLVLEGEG